MVVSWMSKWRWAANILATYSSLCTQGAPLTNAHSKLTTQCQKSDVRCKYFANLFSPSIGTSRVERSHILTNCQITVDWSHIAKSQWRYDRRLELDVKVRSVDPNILTICSPEVMVEFVCSGMRWHQLVATSTLSPSSANATSQSSSRSRSTHHWISKSLKPTNFKVIFGPTQDWPWYEALWTGSPPVLRDQRLAWENIASN